MVSATQYFPTWHSPKQAEVFELEGRVSHFGESCRRAERWVAMPQVWPLTNPSLLRSTGLAWPTSTGLKSFKKKLANLGRAASILLPEPGFTAEQQRASAGSAARLVVGPGARPDAI